MNKDELIKVTNRDNGSVGYTIPDLHLHRVFLAGETKEITMDELRKLAFIPGGLNILKNYLVMDSEEAVSELLVSVEPEYYYTEEDIKTLLTVGTLAQLEDCLNFAPEGTINLLKKVSVELPLNDVAKRELILKTLGFNITTAIAAREPEESPVTEKVRKSDSIKNTVISSANTRKSAPVTATNKYNIVKK